MSCRDDDTIPRTCADAFARISTDLGELKAMAAGTRDQAMRVNGNIERMFGRLDDQNARLAVLETRAAAGGGPDRESLRTALLAGVKAMPAVLAIIAALVAVIAVLVNQGVI